MIVKEATIGYVPFAKDIFGPGMDLPAHVKLSWKDDKGRTCSHELRLSAAEIKLIADLPNK